SIDHIEELANGRGMFVGLGEDVFDEYWMNYGRMIIKGKTGSTKTLSNLTDFLNAKGIDTGLINHRRRKAKSLPHDK
ncbi:restriction endonuclease, partial [bacterium]|nr:restriction endonuclease [bacterium]